MARPFKYTAEVKKKIGKMLDEYIEANDIPIIAEFCYLNNIRKERMYEFAREEGTPLSHSMKKAMEKKEANLEKMSLYGQINYKMAIFSLKQLGWRDRPEDESIDNKLDKLLDYQSIKIKDGV